MIIDCLSKLILLVVIYNIVAISLFGVPKSLSATHNLFKERANALKFLFPFTTFTIAILFLPCWLSCSPTVELKLLSVLSSLALMGVGITYMFNDKYITEAVHLTTACLGIAFMLIWIVFVTPYWYVIILCLLMALIFGAMTKTLKTASIYWIEMAALVSNIIVILLYYFNFIKI